MAKQSSFKFVPPPTKGGCLRLKLEREITVLPQEDLVIDYNKRTVYIVERDDDKRSSKPTGR